jgi:hypothetical protein
MRNLALLGQRSPEAETVQRARITNALEEEREDSGRICDAPFASKMCLRSWFLGDARNETTASCNK